MFSNEHSRIERKDCDCKIKLTSKTFQLEEEQETEEVEEEEDKEGEEDKEEELWHLPNVRV